MKHKNDMKFTYFVVLPRWKKHHPKKVAPLVGARGVTIVCDIEAYPKPDFQVGQLNEIATNDGSRICQTAWGGGTPNPKAKAPTYYFGHVSPKLYKNGKVYQVGWGGGALSSTTLKSANGNVFAFLL